ncbi:glycosyltransferase family 4 protein [Halobellus sp. EA9]|uniref:glycosyltransferase family 4 protein n=1 Tax=Halobellus sp. EA9 TaxID=3421647 RepID=UPI003EB69DB9
MKILHIYDEYDQVLPGEGSGPYIVYKLAKEMARADHDVTVLERQWEGTDRWSQRDDITFHRVKLYFCSDDSRNESSRPRNLIQTPTGVAKFLLDRSEMALKIFAHLRQNEYDAIFVYSPFVANILVTLSSSVRNKTVYRDLIGEVDVRLGLTPKSDRPLAFRYILPDLYLIKRAGKTILQNDRLRADVEEHEKVKPENVTAIPYGVDTDTFTPEIPHRSVRERYDLSANQVVLYSSPLIPRKGFDHLVRAADILVNEKGNDDILFVIKSRFYEDEYLTELREMRRDYGLTNNLKLIINDIPFEDLKSMYVASDVYVQPSLQDPCPTSLLEPMSCGQPLVGSDIGGISQMIEDGVNGYLVKPGDERTLASAIDKILSDPGLRQSMGQKSREIAVERFDWNKIATRHLQVCHQITSNQ